MIARASSFRKRILGGLYALAALALLAALLMPVHKVSSEATERFEAVDGGNEGAAIRARAPVEIRGALARPLFHADRAPYKQPPKAVAAPRPSAPMRLELAGIVVNARGSWAYIKNPASGETVRAVLGDQIDGWSVAEITRDSVKLVRGGEDAILEAVTANGKRR